MKESEQEYAVAAPCRRTPRGSLYVLGRQPSDTRKLEEGRIDVGNWSYGGHEAAVIFQDVFVPWERVFMHGETAFAGELVETFAGYHRSSYGGCKVGVGDVLIGAASAIARCQGTAQASHVRDKLIEMVHLNETMYACGIAASSEGQRTDSGTYLVDLRLANVCKLNVTRCPYEIARLAQDIAGGLLATMPSELDFESPETGALLTRYLAGRQEVPTEYRQRMLRLIENLTIGAGAAGYLVESLHGAGSPMAQRIQLGRMAGLEEKEADGRADRRD